MTCCIVALALVWHLLEAWRRLKGWLGITGPARTQPRTTGVAAAAIVDFLRRPALRAALATVIALEAGVAGAYAYDHRHHIGNEVAAAVHGATGFAVDLCHGLADGGS